MSRQRASTEQQFATPSMYTSVLAEVATRVRRRAKPEAISRERVLVQNGAWVIPPVERPTDWNRRPDWRSIRDPW